jgi:hypothetical protein
MPPRPTRNAFLSESPKIWGKLYPGYRAPCAKGCSHPRYRGLHSKASFLARRRAFLHPLTVPCLTKQIEVTP